MKKIRPLCRVEADIAALESSNPASRVRRPCYVLRFCRLQMERVRFWQFRMGFHRMFTEFHWDFGENMLFI